MAAKLIVKSVENKKNNKVAVYTTMPSDIVAPKLYTEVDASLLTPLFTGKYAYIAKQLASKGAAYIGNKETGGIKDAIRQALKGGMLPTAPAQPGVEVNAASTPNEGGMSEDAKARRNAALARGRETARRNREARKAEQQQQGGSNGQQVELVLTSQPSMTIAEARVIALQTGDFGPLEMLLDQKHGVVNA